METELFTRGWDVRSAKKTLKSQGWKVTDDYFSCLTSNAIFALWDPNPTTGISSNNKETMVWQQYFSTVCTTLEDKYPKYLPLTFDSRLVKKLWREKLIEMLNVLTQQAQLNSSLKSKLA